jgi:16S rRNA (cytidine1402-2'-O)-methyltransferase
LISAARSAGVAVEVLPGPSAAFGVAALSGFPLKRFAFEGFPPRSATARRDAFTRALLGDCTTIWFESPQRIRATLADLAEVARDARVFLVREYTKLHEQQLAGTPSEVAAGLPESVRGEISFAIAPHHPTREPAGAPSGGDIDAAIDALLAQDLRLGDIAKQLARRGFGQRGALYDRASARRAAGKGAPSSAESTDR